MRQCRARFKPRNDNNPFCFEKIILGIIVRGGGGTGHSEFRESSLVTVEGHAAVGSGMVVVKIKIFRK